MSVTTYTMLVVEGDELHQKLTEEIKRQLTEAVRREHSDLGEFELEFELINRPEGEEDASGMLDGRQNVIGIADLTRPIYAGAVERAKFYAFDRKNGRMDVVTGITVSFRHN